MTTHPLSAAQLSQPLDRKHARPLFARPQHAGMIHTVNAQEEVTYITSILGLNLTHQQHHEKGAGTGLMDQIDRARFRCASRPYGLMITYYRPYGALFVDALVWVKGWPGGSK